jgi:hypothetical protein
MTVRLFRYDHLDDPEPRPTVSDGISNESNRPARVSVIREGGFPVHSVVLLPGGLLLPGWRREIDDSITVGTHAPREERISVSPPWRIDAEGQGSAPYVVCSSDNPFPAVTH